MQGTMVTNFEREDLRPNLMRAAMSYIENISAHPEAKHTD